METKAYVNHNVYHLFSVQHYQFPIFSSTHVLYCKESYFSALIRKYKKQPLEFKRLPPTFENYGKVLGNKDLS